MSSSDGRLPPPAGGVTRLLGASTFAYTKPAQGSNTAHASVATLLNSAIGAGVLSLPFAFQCAGWAGGLLSTVFIAAVEAFTLYVLSRYAEFTGTSSYSQLVRRMLGKKASMAMSIILLLYSFGSSVAYLIILGDCFEPLAKSLLGAGHWYTSRQSVIGLGATAFMLPLCFPTTLGAIASVSYLTFWSIMLVVGAVVFRSTQIVGAEGYSWADVRAWDLSMRYFQAVPILVFGFQCHTNVVSVFGELEDEPSFTLFPLPTPFGSSSNLQALEAEEGGAASGDAPAGGGAAPAEPPPPRAPPPPPPPPPASRYESLPQVQREGPASADGPALACRMEQHFSLRRPKSLKLQGMVQVVITAIALTLVFYVLVGLFGYLAFPTNAASNILNSFPAGDRLMAATRVVVGAIQVAHYPVTHHPARNAIRDLLHACGWQFHPGAFNVVETLAFFASSLAVGLAVQDLGSVFSLIGGSCGAAFILGFPGALLIQYAWSKQRQSLAALAERRGGPRAPLLGGGGAAPGGPASPGAAAAAPPPPYLARRSKLFWVGCLLILLCLALFAITIYGIAAKP